MNKKAIATFISACLALLLISPATASKGGVEQLNNQFVVGFTFSNDGVPSLCNGALIATNVIATARHCVINKLGIFGSKYVFSAPGAKLDTKIDRTRVPTGIKEFIIPKQTPMEGIDSRLDLAYIVTDKPFLDGKPIAIATTSDLASLSEYSEISGYGYGEVFETGELYSSYPRKFSLSWRASFLVPESNSLYELLNESNTACSGDSGGPVTVKLANGSEVLIGVISGAGEVVEGCGTKAQDDFYHVRISTLAPYLDLIPKPVVTPKPKIKKITCIKGTKKKVITGVNPKCPKGYKLKK